MGTPKFTEESIWEDLRVQAWRTHLHIKEEWRKSQEFPSMLLSWPSEPIPCDDNPNVLIKELVIKLLEPGDDIISTAHSLSKKTKAYAIILVKRETDNLKILLESHHGTFVINTPIERHGDVDVLGNEKDSKDTEYLGVLWSPTMKSTRRRLS